MNRRERRKQKRELGTDRPIIMHTVAIDMAAVEGLDGDADSDVDVFDLIGYHVKAALVQVAAKGGDVLKSAVVTIGSTHPDYPGALVVQAKTDAHLPAPGPGEAEVES